MVQFTTVAGPAIVTPPPPPVAVLPVKVQLRSDRVPSQFWRPPPSVAAVLPVKVQSVTVSNLPSSSRPPPSWLEWLPEKVQLRTVSCVAPVSWKRPPPLPEALLLEKVLLLTTLGVLVLVLELTRPPP